MADNKHDTESQGAKVRDHAHERHHYWRRAHLDWRLWAAVVLMLAMMVIYIMTVNLSRVPGKPATQPTPEALP